jgi:hypothetical protein
MLAPAGLHLRLAQDIRAALELAEKLIVEIVAVGQHHQRRVTQRPFRRKNAIALQPKTLLSQGYGNYAVNQAHHEEPFFAGNQRQTRICVL